MSQPILSRAKVVAVQFSEWIVLALLLAASLPPILLRHECLTWIGDLDLLDGSWLLDASYKASGRIWFGRDVVFTYGPLFQWLSSAPSRWIGLSFGAIYATWYTLPLLLIIVATFLTARLLLANASPWRRALLVTLAVVFWSPPDLRVAFCILAFAVFLRLTEAPEERSFAVGWTAGAAAAICVVGFLLSADTGIYTAAALLLCVVSTAVASRSIRMAGFLAIVLVVFGGLTLLTNGFMASPMDFRFWRSSLALASGYRWFEALSIARADKWLVLRTLALSIPMFLAAWSSRHSDGNQPRRRVFLVAGFLLAFLILQSGLVRSDHQHVLVGIYPMVFFCGVIAFQQYRARLLSIGLPVAALITTLVLASSFPPFRPAEAVSRWRQVLHPVLRCPAGTVEFDHACLASGDADLASKVSAYVQAQAPPGAMIAVFPYQTAFGFLSQHQVAEGVLQGYLVNGEYLTQVELSALRQARAPLALYFPDHEAGGNRLHDKISLDVDGVPNFTRSPEVWFYYAQHYRTQASPFRGVLALTRDDSRATRLSFQERQILPPLAPVRVRKRHFSIELGQLQCPKSAADFLRIRLRVDYPLWWRFRKPSRLAFEISYQDGTHKSIAFVLPPNRSTDIWVYPWNEKEMGKYFSDDQARWRDETRAELASLRLVIAPYDWMSVAPDSVTVEAASAVKLDLAQSTASNLNRSRFYAGYALRAQSLTLIP